MKKQIHPAMAVAASVLILGVFLWSFWIGPALQEQKSAKEWTSAESIANRGPNRKSSPEYDSHIRDLLMKEGANRMPSRRGQ